MALTVRDQIGLGYLPDLADQRDYMLSAAATNIPVDEALQPVHHTVRNFLKKFLVPYDQGDLGSCVANAASTMFCFVRNVASRSRLQLYYEARRLIGLTEVDSGCYIRDMMKVTSQLGAGRETWWPYDIAKFREDPPLKVDRDALLRRIMIYYRLTNRQDFRRCLLENHPFVIGFSVYSEFMSDRTMQWGIVPLPAYTEKMLGGHAITVYAYDDDFVNSDWAKTAVAGGFPLHAVPKQVYICRNSWGEWGNHGDFAIDANYLENYLLARDAWTQRRY